MGHGESYEDNARRELEEEMGVKAAPKTDGGGGGGGGSGRAEGELRHCFSFHYKDGHTNVWGDAWDCVWAGEIVPQPVCKHVCTCLSVVRFRAFATAVYDVLVYQARILKHVKER